MIVWIDLKFNVGKSSTMDDRVPFIEELGLSPDHFLEFLQENPVAELPQPSLPPQSDSKIRLTRKRKAPTSAVELSEVSELV